MARVTAKPGVERERKVLTRATPTPSSRDAAVQAKKTDRVSWVPKIESSTANFLLTMMVILMVLLFCPDAGQDVLLITGAVFGEGHGPGSRPVQQMAEPQGAGAGDLDLHQHLVRPQQGCAVVPQAQVQGGVPPAQAGVKGDAQLRVLR